MQVFLTLAALGLLIMICLPLLGALNNKRRGTRYFRGRTYRVGWRQHEFHIYGPTSLDEVETLIAYLSNTFKVAVSEHDPEPDESFWVLEGELGAITLFYDDHEGARIRTIRKAQRGLFQWLVREIPLRRFGI